MLGFRPLEPAVLPPGFELYARRVEQFDVPLPVREIEARARGVSLAEVPEKSEPSLSLEYRFRDSEFVPAIVIREDLGDAASLSLTPEARGCAEVVSLATGPALYGVGSGRLRRGPTAGSWLGCAQIMPNDRQVHAVMMARGNVLIQVRAFPESNLTRADILRLAASIRPAG